MKICFHITSGSAPPDPGIPKDIPPQNITTLLLMPGSNMFVSAFNEKDEIFFTKQTLDPLGYMAFNSGRPTYMAG